MSHNIAPSRPTRATADVDRVLVSAESDDIPGNGSGRWADQTNYILATFANRRRETNILFREDGIVLNPWDEGRAVEVIGEDLYAFRELLNALPEEAFVRPADPIEEVYTLRDRDGDWWVYEEGSWRVLAFDKPYRSAPKFVSERFASTFTDPDADVLIDAVGLYAEPKPFWSVGDLVAYDSTTMHSVFERKADGWHRISSNSGTLIGLTEVTDDTMRSRANRQTRYTVLRRKNTLD